MARDIALLAGATLLLRNLSVLVYGRAASGADDTPLGGPPPAQGTRLIPRRLLALNGGTDRMLATWWPTASSMEPFMILVAAPLLVAVRGHRTALRRPVQAG